MAEKSVSTLSATNAEILNAIRTDASFAYQQRIPAADQGDISTTVNALENYKPEMNEFVDALVNRIGLVEIKSKIWTNPLAQFKRGMLQFGESIEEVGTTLVQAERYDPNKTYDDVFKRSDPTLISNFHKINRQDMYALSINDTMLRRAFIDNYGLQDLLGKVLQTPYTSDYWDEYLIMKQLFVEMAKNGWFYKVEVANLDAASTKDERQTAAMDIVEKVRAYTGKMKFLSGRYNAAGIPTATAAEDMVLFATPEFVAALDVNVLAFAFNVSAAEVPSRIVEIDDFGIDGCQAILADRDLFMCADTHIGFESIRNPKGLSWNYFLHHHGIYSMSRMVNAIMFTTEEGTASTTPTIAVSSVALDFATVDGVKPTFAKSGEGTQLAATVTGTVTPATEGYSVPQGVVYAITSVTGGPLKLGTAVDADGVLHVAADEKATDVTVTATSTFTDPTKPLSGQTAKSATKKIGIDKATS